MCVICCVGDLVCLCLQHRAAGQGRRSTLRACWSGNTSGSHSTRKPPTGNQPLNHSLNHSLSHSTTHSTTHSVIQPLKHSLNHSLTQSQSGNDNVMIIMIIIVIHLFPHTSLQSVYMRRTI